MIEFEVKSKTQPIGKRKGQTVYFAQPVSQQHLTNKMVVDRIVRETSLSAGDVSNALISLGAIVRDAFEFEERNNIWNTPYLFNAKEFDEETGLYYYGARYYEPRVSLWISVDPIANYNPLNSENYLDGEHNNGVFNHKNLNCYSYCYGNPIKFSDPNGKQVVAVHGTWSNSDTWKDQKGIFEYAHKKFNNNRKNFLFNWSGKNNRTGRTVAAKSLITYISKLRKNVSQNEPLTLVGHSHGGNVSIEAINMLVNMPEFDDIKINLLTINTPVREDYQLSSKAQSRVTHINVYDPLDPVQSRGGNDYSIPYAGEMGKAGRTFKNSSFGFRL